MYEGVKVNPSTHFRGGFLAIMYLSYYEVAERGLRIFTQTL